MSAAQEKATVEQLELLSVTENHLMETYKLPFSVIASSFTVKQASLTLDTVTLR
jgi:hypothetical protein